MSAGIPIIETVEAVGVHLAPYRTTRKTIALVPTMGALHEGHLELIRRAGAAGDHVVVSIFVNPAQFAPHEDYGTYPRNFDDDMQKITALNLGSISIFAPDVNEMYPGGGKSPVLSGNMQEIAARWEGMARPHFFGGVVQAVSRLFEIVQPDVAFFGEKDFQQLQVVRQLTQDQSLPVKIVGVPTVREKTGLALSSRNAYLNDNERNHIAPQLLAALTAAAKAIQNGTPLSDALQTAQDQLLDTGFHQVDYIAYVDSQNLAPLAHAQTNARILAAVRLGKTRLIDNIAAS